MREFVNRPARIIGLFFLGIALLMLILGQTFLSGKFSAFGYILYWGLCAIFTILAACVALVDLMHVKHESRSEHQDLIEETLSQIEQDKKAGNPPGKTPDKSV